MSFESHVAWADILHKDDESRALLASCGWAKGFHKERINKIELREIKGNTIMYGAGGTGKTTCVMAFNPTDKTAPRSVYIKNYGEGDFWGGGATAYKNEAKLLFEEFEGQITLSSLKMICDLGKSGPNINIKNGGAKLNHDEVFFCSNSHPAGWFRGVWKKDPKQWEPFRRRITKVLFFPEFRPDGSRNEPDDEHNPYIIDQTEEWNTWKGEEGLVKAAEHAAIHWPLKDTDTGGEFRDGFNAHNLRN
uniref:Replication-associated protein n=1 Tax=Chaetoceros debilis DNA virus TaxID=647443 RepID=C4B9I5_9VIRU|nr:putative replication-associated protein [Chaetoceros debilis DNA virus]